MTIAPRLWRVGRGTAGRWLQLVRETWSLALLSLALAVSLWAFVTDEQNPARQETFPALIPVEPVNVPPGLAVASVESVQVRIRAPEDVLHRLSRDSFKATVDLSGVRTRESSAFVLVRVPSERNVEIVAVEPAFVRVTLEPRLQRVLLVQVRRQGAPPTGYEVTSLRVTPSEITVSGPESIVELADRATVEVGLTGVHVSFRQVSPITVLSRQGGRLEGLTIDPPTATVDVTMTAQTVTHTVVVTPSLKGNPAPGYNVASIQVEPVSLRVTGPIEAVQALQAGLATEDVDITDATGPQELVRSVGLKLPQGLRAEQGQVIVRLRLQPARGEQMFQVVPQVSGLGPGLIGVLSPPTVEVRLGGEILGLQRLSPSSITVTADIDATGPGTYTAELKVQPPSGFQLIDWRPRLVTVSVTRR